MKRYISSTAIFKTNKPKAIVRLPEVRRRLGNISQTTLEENFLKPKRLHKVKLGPRAAGVVESELDGVIDELAGEGE